MSASPIQPTTFRPQAFATSRRFTPPPTFRAFRRGNARGVLPPGASPPVQASRARHPRNPLLAFLPRIARSPPRKGEYRGRNGGYPSTCPQLPFSPSGSLPVRKSVPRELTVKRSRRSIPSWASSSLGFFHSGSRRTFTSATLVLHRLWLQSIILRRSTAPTCDCTSAFLASGTVPLSLESSSPFEVSRLQLLNRVG
jgi:hypothetical protein